MKKKMTARERRAEEKRILAEMDKAMSEQNQGSNNTPTGPSPTHAYGKDVPERVHCKRCKTLMEKGVCPTCGFKIYMPMDENTRKKIRLGITIAAVVVFVALFILLQSKKG